MCKKKRLILCFVVSMIFGLFSVFFGACGNKNPTKSSGSEQGSLKEYNLNVIMLDMFIGESFDLEVLDLEKGTVVEWNTNNDSVATVENGTVTAISDGNAVISAIFGEVMLECNVIVRISYEYIPVIHLVDEIINADGTYSLQLLVGDVYGFYPELQVGQEKVVTAYTVTSESSSILVNEMMITALSTCEDAKVIISCEYEAITYNVIVNITVH